MFISFSFDVIESNVNSRMYPASLQKLVSFIHTHLLVYSRELNDLFAEHVYAVIEKEIVQYIKVFFFSWFHF